jgi:hypothetical protein
MTAREWRDLFEVGTAMTIEINGMAHVVRTVSCSDVAREAYRKLLSQLGMKPVLDGDKLYHGVGGRTAIGIQPGDPRLGSEPFDQRRVGRHHLCLRARARHDAVRCAAVLKEMAATIIRKPEQGRWAPGCGAPAPPRFERLTLDDAHRIGRADGAMPARYHGSAETA